MARLEEVAVEFSAIKEIRGAGLMRGIELDIPVKPIIVSALNYGLVLIAAGQNVIRFLPPLIINKNHIDEMIEILRLSLSDTILGINE